MSAAHRPAASSAVGAVLTRWATIRAWAADIGGFVAVGLAIPIAILVVGTPIVLIARLVIELLARL
jgi:hypothetical protein